LIGEWIHENYPVLLIRTQQLELVKKTTTTTKKKQTKTNPDPVIDLHPCSVTLEYLAHPVFLILANLPAHSTV